MLDLLFLGIVIAGFWHFSQRIEKNAEFEIWDDSVYFKGKKLLIPYSNIISLERDISSAEGRTMYFGYIITYYKETDKIDSFRIYKALNDAVKWERFKRKLLEHNPSVKINESIF